MRLLFKLILLLIASGGWQSVYAGAGWYVTIHNDTAQDLTLSYAGSDNWYCNDFCFQQVISAQETRTFYTEEYAAYWYGPSILGIDLNGEYAAHVEFWNSVGNFPAYSKGYWEQHQHSVTQNFSLDRIGDSELVFCGTNHPQVYTKTQAYDDGWFGRVKVAIIVEPLASN